MLGVTTYKGFLIPGLPVYFMNNMLELLKDLDEKEFPEKRGLYEEQVAINALAGLTAPISYKNQIDNLPFSINGIKGEIDYLIETASCVYVFEIKTQLKNKINWKIDNHEFANFKKGIKQLRKNNSYLQTKTNKPVFSILVTSTSIEKADFVKELVENKIATIEINTLVNWAISIFVFNMDFKDVSKAIIFLFESSHLQGNKMAFIPKVLKKNWTQIEKLGKAEQFFISRGKTSISIHDAIRTFEKKEGFERLGKVIRYIFRSGEAKFKNNLHDADIINE